MLAIAVLFIGGFGGEVVGIWVVRLGSMEVRDSWPGSRRGRSGGLKHPCNWARDDSFRGRPLSVTSARSINYFSP